jgi:hypothetical protein
MILRVLLCWSIAWGACCSETGVDSASFATSDESGTLIMISRTQSQVVLGVDSKITYTDYESGAGSAQSVAEKKLVEVNQNGACAIEGFTGNRPLRISVSATVESWLKAHPSAEVGRDLMNILDAAGTAWNSANYQRGHLPKARKVGSPISTFICGDTANGQPIIVRGQTYVSQNLRAKARLIPPYKADFFYASGFLNEVLLERTIFDPKFDFSRDDDPGMGKVDSEIIAEIRKSPQGMGALRVWNSINADSRRWPRDPTSVLPPPPTEWNLGLIKDAFAVVFAAVENHTPVVAPPNQIVIVGPCGRTRTVLNAMVWPDQVHCHN